MKKNLLPFVNQVHRPRRLSIYIAVGLLAIAGFGGVSVFISYQHDIQAARDHLAKIPTQIYRSQYGDIEYYLTGNGPTVLVSHGVTGGIDQGMRLTDQFGFFDKGYRFLYVSRFGYLKSSFPKDASARLQAAAYRELLDYLGIDKVFVFGNSAGGTSAMWFAIDFPDRAQGLILHSSAIPGPLLAPPPKLVVESDLAYWAAIKAAPDMLIGTLLPASILSTLTREEKASLIENVYMAGLPITERAKGVIFDNDISTPSVNDIPFEQIKIPTLILQAVDDPREKAGGSELAKRIAGSEYVELTGGHLLLRQEDKVKTEIAEFISNHK